MHSGWRAGARVLTQPGRGEPWKRRSLKGESRALALKEGPRVPAEQPQLHTQEAGKGWDLAGRC